MKNEEDQHKRAGYLGGTAFREKPRWFELHPELASIAGANGGKKSKRGSLKRKAILQDEYAKRAVRAWAIATGAELIGYNPDVFEFYDANGGATISFNVCPVVGVDDEEKLVGVHTVQKWCGKYL